MAIKKSKSGVKCSFCAQDAKWHNFWSHAPEGKNACEKHKNKIEVQDSGHMTEADYQTWGRL